MNVRLAAVGCCLLLVSSGLFAASGAPQGVPLGLTAVASVGALAALAGLGVQRSRTV